MQIDINIQFILKLKSTIKKRYLLNIKQIKNKEEKRNKRRQNLLQEITLMYCCDSKFIYAVSLICIAENNSRRIIYL